MHRYGITLVGLLVAAAGTSSSAAIVTVSPSNHDNTIFKSGTGNSAGAQTQMYAGANGSDPSADRALVSFDLTGISNTAVVQSVQLKLVLSQVAGTGGGGGGGGSNPDTTPREIDLHKLSASWGEGTVSSGGGQGSLAKLTDSVGNATWNSAFAATNTSADVPWTPGGSFAAAISGAQLINNSTLGTVYTWDSTATTLNGGATTLANSNPVDNSAMVADVQSWISSGGATNFGWILINTDETTLQDFRAFNTRDVATSSLRPSLVITLVPEPASGTMLLSGVVGLLGWSLWRGRRRG